MLYEDNEIKWNIFESNLTFVSKLDSLIILKQIIKPSLQGRSLRAMAFKLILYLYTISQVNFRFQLLLTKVAKDSLTVTFHTWDMWWKKLHYTFNSFNKR